VTSSIFFSVKGSVGLTLIVVQARITGATVEAGSNAAGGKRYERR
jgi:hypothetical protein